MKSTSISVGWKRRMLPLAAALIYSGASSAPAADYATTILADHPLAYWRLEEASGSATGADSTPNANTGFVTYATQADGVTVFPQLGVPAIFTNGAAFAVGNNG